MAGIEEEAVYLHPDKNWTRGVCVTHGLHTKRTTEHFSTGIRVWKITGQMET